MKTEKLENLVSKLLKRYSAVIKSVWLVPEMNDMLIVLLDDTQPMEETSIIEIENETRKIIKKSGEKVTVSFYRLSDYWEAIRHGSPVTFTEIKEGVPIYDPSGFFIPLKKLLMQGRIPGTKEAMKSMIDRAPMRLLKIERIHFLRIIDLLHNAVVDSGQAPLLMIGVAPPKPKDLPASLETHFVNRGLLESDYVDHCEYVIKYWKMVEHGKIKEFEPELVDIVINYSIEFVERMERLVEELRE
jgi:hypothetical protein